MFTGIVEETGTVVSTERDSAGLRLRLEASFGPELDHGQSVSVSGVCLTVEDQDEETFELFLAAETLSRTYLGRLDPGDQVNLERALAASARFDGHVVQGHVDATAEVLGIKRVGGDEPGDSVVVDAIELNSSDRPSYETDESVAYGGDWEFVFSLPEPLNQYVVEKGSIAVDGVSLTVASLEHDRFATAIIPATYELTTLSEKSVGDPVHLEADVLAKYVERLLEGHQ